MQRAPGVAATTDGGTFPIAEARSRDLVPAPAMMYRESRSYVVAVESWIEASVGPPYISAYVKILMVIGIAVLNGILLVAEASTQSRRRSTVSGRMTLR